MVKMTAKEHKECHQQLYFSLTDLLFDFFTQHLRICTDIEELKMWACKQAECPDHPSFKISRRRGE